MGEPIIKCNKFVWRKVSKYIHQCLVENRHLFVDTLVNEHYFPINILYGFFKYFQQLLYCNPKLNVHMEVGIQY